MLLPFDSSSDEEDLPRPRVFRPRNMVEHHREVDVRQHFRLPTEAIEMLVERVNGSLRSFYNARSTDLTPTDQLSIALTYYATGDHYRNVGTARGVSAKTVSVVVDRVTEALLQLAPEYVRMPSPHEAIAIQQGFYQIDGMPRVMGIVDGTHLECVRPTNADDGPYICRKGYPSINAMGVVDYKKKFISSLQLFTPIARPRDIQETRYNVAHRRTRTWVEHAFGLLKMRWRVLHSEWRLQPVKLCKVASVCATLHNIAIDYAGAAGDEPDPPAEDDGDENDENAAPTQQEDARDANAVRRDYVVRYFAH